MTLSHKQTLEIKTSQSMVMTESLQQSIKLLQLSAIELNSFIATELEKNPLLSNQSEEDSAEDPITNSSEEDNYNDENSSYSVTNDGIDNDHRWDNSQTHIEAPSPYESNLTYSDTFNRKTSNFDNQQEYNIDNNPKAKTLREHILEQIYLDINNPTERMIALNIADLLNENGYIEGDLHKLAENLGCNKEEIYKVLSFIQNFDPPGVFARNLSECLLLQLKDKGTLTAQMEKFLANLHLIGENKLNELKKICSLKEEQLNEMIKQIRSLNPKPGSDFAQEITSYMQPEVFVKKGKEGFIIELNNEVLPKLLVNRRYYSEVKKKAKDKHEQKYLSDQLYTANWLIKALDQRAQTILKVASEIVARQHDFFEKGILHLKPLTLITVAESLNMHESTVSRVTTNKYIATPSGLFEMKYFFSSKLEREGSEDCSSTTVKHIIKDLIIKETAILSDQQIVEFLQSKNIIIARRTVAKYRDELNIPPSSIRRREKRLK